LVQGALHWRDEKYKKNTNLSNIHTEFCGPENIKKTGILLNNLDVAITPHLPPLSEGLPLHIPQGFAPVGSINTSESTGESIYICYTFIYIYIYTNIIRNQIVMT
jgi:hypothetical protein